MRHSLIYAEVSVEPLSSWKERKTLCFFMVAHLKHLFIINCKLNASFILSYPAADFRNNTEWLLYRQMCTISNPDTVKIIDRWSTETLERKDGLNWDLANVSILHRASVRTCELALVNVSRNSDPLILSFRAEAHLNQHHAIVNIV